LQGPGCLNYSLIFNIGGNPALHSITGANRHIMERQRAALAGVLGRAVRVQGFTDLSLEDKKFSGNAQRRKRQALLFHGTFLLHFELSLVQKLLPMPSRRPDYRQERTHGQFLTNLEVPASLVKRALREAWSAEESCEKGPLIKPELEQKYAGDEWNRRF
jgi:lipoate-protein ligase A